MEGPRVAIVYNENHHDAETTRAIVEAKGGEYLVLRHAVRHAAECRAAVAASVERFGAPTEGELEQLGRRAAVRQVAVGLGSMSDCFAGYGSCSA